MDASSQGIRRLPAMRRTVAMQRTGASLSLAAWLLVIGASTWNHVERPVRVAEAMRLRTMGK